ncbi:CD2 antigen cytoplasmic tail-binding protein 2-like protein [Leptotrombidium deliense]|uniref:CD2 antigen cytoplasmic tail-binding protein 2-like protein n=1 Tax=Leptotrombidium deliense TaxID=299467 RepID=A0A443SRM6_9ACAR|nr:CD2 antigen cytoplasmic tail-binding protein 2-like protein [Leptotrombidium deliense]
MEKESENTDAVLPSHKRKRHDTCEDKYDIESAFEAKERECAAVDEHIGFTAFNMDDELEEGHFDDEGTFIFRRDKEQLADWWIDNVDRSQLAEVKHKENKDDDCEPEIDLKKCYAEIVDFMIPHETVANAIQRLGKINKNTQKDKQKRQSEESVSDERAKVREKLSQIISLADRILQTGDTDVYEKTYEQIVYINNKHEAENCG